MYACLNVYISILKFNNPDISQRPDIFENLDNNCCIIITNKWKYID